MSSLPVVSVIIPAFRRTAQLRKAIVSALSQDLAPVDYEVLVVDSSPDDRNRILVEELKREAGVSLEILVKRPEGPGASRNLGAKQARGRFLAFMDSDCEAHPSWLRHSLAAFSEGVGIVQGKTLPDPEGRLGVFTWYPMNESEYFVYECTNIVYRREAFEQAGGFPSREDPFSRAERPLGGEDVELAWTVKRLGWRSCFATESVVYHEVVKISPWQWLFQERLLLWPYLASKYPELRVHFFGRYFWDTAQAYLLLAFAGAGLVALTPWAALLGLPYLIYRAYPSSRSFPGPLRPLRVVPYFARDLTWLLLLIAGSLRHRSVLL